MLPGILKILGQGSMAVYCILATYLGIYLGMSRILRKLGTLWTCLGFFGHGYNQFANALEWILQNYDLHWLIHYLDDYFLAGPPNLSICHDHLQCFLKVCKLLGFPVAMDKVEGPAITLIFLGLELDSVLKQIRLPKTKLDEILMELTNWLRHRKTIKREHFCSLVS